MCWTRAIVVAGAELEINNDDPAHDGAPALFGLWKIDEIDIDTARQVAAAILELIEEVEAK